MKRAIIIGASSGIGRQVAQLLIQDGWHVGVAARRKDALAVLKQMAPDRVAAMQIDVTDTDASIRLTELINELGGMSLFFYAAGIGWQNKELTPEKELATMETNATGFTRMVGAAFRYFATGAGGHIAVISSIAGTKGLGPAPAYSATKSLQATYLQALEQLANTRRLHIQITDIRPGFVNTPLLGGGTYPMLMSTNNVAKHIVKALYKKRHVVIIDWRWRIITFFWRMIPRPLWRRIRL